MASLKLSSRSSFRRVASASSAKLEHDRCGTCKAGAQRNLCSPAYGRRGASAAIGPILDVPCAYV
jgi:hypothetical protein